MLELPISSESWEPKSPQGSGAEFTIPKVFVRLSLEESGYRNHHGSVRVAFRERASGSDLNFLTVLALRVVEKLNERIRTAASASRWTDAVV